MNQARFSNFEEFLRDIEGKPRAYVEQACNHEHQELEPLRRLSERERRGFESQIDYFCLLRDFVDLLKGYKLSPMRDREEARKRMAEIIESMRNAERGNQEAGER
jgi:hypothetical protein